MDIPTSLHKLLDATSHQVTEGEPFVRLGQVLQINGEIYRYFVGKYNETINKWNFSC